MERRIAHIPLKEVESKPLFNLSFRSDDDELKGFIKEYEFVFPILLWKSENRKWIIDGSRRYHVAKTLKWKSIPSIVYSEKEMTKSEAFLLALRVNRALHSFNIIEKGRVLKEAKELLPEEMLISRVLPALNLHQLHQAKAYLHLLQLPHSIQEVAVKENIPPTVISRFLSFATEEREKIFEALLEIPLNQNKLGEVLEWLSDLSRRDETSALEILNNTLEQIGDEPDARLKGEYLREHLKMKRYPLYQKKKNQFEGTVKKLKLPKKIQTSSPDFEEGSVELRMKLSSVDEKNEIIKALQKEEWEKLLSLL